MSSDAYRKGSPAPFCRDGTSSLPQVAPIKGLGTVLVVDDEEQTREITRMLLEEAYHILVARDGIEALEILRTGTVDLVLTDLRMPRMDGLDLVRSIRSEAALCDLPIIVMTGLGDEKAGEIVKAGADDYVIKPFTCAMLLARVDARMEIARLRREAERERQQSTRILEGITDGFVAFDREGRVTHLNTEGERILGRKRSELLGKVLWEESPDIVGTQIYDACHHGTGEQVPRTHEFYYPRLSAWLDIRTYPTADEGLSVFFRDISRRKRAEEAAAVNEQWFQLMMESAKDYAIFSMDPERHITSWNSGAERIFGYTGKEIMGQKVDLLFVREDRQKGAAAAEANTALQTGASEDERWHLRKNGSRFYASGVVRPIYGPSGELQGLMKICRDETERMRGMEALRLSEERFRLLVEAIHDYAIILLDQQGRIVSWNRSAERVTGYSEYEIVGQRFSILFPPESEAGNEPQQILETSATIGCSKQEGWRVRKDGSRFWAVCNVAAIRDERDQLTGFSLITGDISSRKEAESEREQLLETLRANDRRKDEFLAMLAHELRNPLAATKNALAVLEMSGDEKEFRWAGHVIQRQ
ncbi:MAG: PAS domain S-box protein, partial [Verrucomicrobiaceae bacterium]